MESFDLVEDFKLQHESLVHAVRGAFYFNYFFRELI